MFKFPSKTHLKYNDACHYITHKLDILYHLFYQMITNIFFQVGKMFKAYFV